MRVRPARAGTLAGSQTRLDDRPERPELPRQDTLIRPVTLPLAAVLTMLAAAVHAQTPPLGGVVAPPPPVLAPSAPASHAPAPIVGAPNAPQTTIIPGSPIPGTVYDNGNGTSTVVIPGGGSQVIPTPR